jgi:hypothetical protein
MPTHIHCEDIRHTLFGCDNSLEVWRKLELADKIEDAMLVDRAGSAVLEELIVNQQVENTRELNLTASCIYGGCAANLCMVRKYLQVRLLRCPFE